MKGPAERLKYNFRRVWECPVCSHHDRSGPETPARLCACQQEKPVGERVWMRLVEDGPLPTAGRNPFAMPASLAQVTFVATPAAKPAANPSDASTTTAAPAASSPDESSTGKSSPGESSPS